MLIRCLLLSVWRKSRPAQFFPSPSTKYNWCWKIWGGEKTDRVGKKLTGYFFLPGKKMTSQFLPRGRNGPAWSFPGERLAGGKNWPLHRYSRKCSDIIAPFITFTKYKGQFCNKVPSLSLFKVPNDESPAVFVHKVTSIMVRNNLQLFVNKHVVCLTWVFTTWLFWRE